jgi:hypothetical protein
MLRPEARPLEFDELDQQQQDGFRRVVDLLASAASAVRGLEDVRSGQTGKRGPFIEQDRSSRTVLVSGQRGTGKTTLALSLTEAFQSTASLSNATDALNDRDLARTIGDLRKRLVWLETLDLEPLDPSTNLLGAVLARIEDVIGQNVPEPTEALSLMHPSPAYHESVRDLRRLQTSVALSFGGNLPNRKGSLDPDNFAIEARRAERERLSPRL